MNQPNPFDLNPAIQRWREQLGQSPAFRRENIDELEAHLRDSVAALQSQGLSAEEAFMVAAKCVGKGSSITAEFAKVNRQESVLSPTACSESWIRIKGFTRAGFTAWSSAKLGSPARLPRDGGHRRFPP